MTERPIYNERFDNREEEFVIADGQAHKEWSALLGVSVPGNKAKVTRAFYLGNLPEIHRIQFASWARAQTRQV